MGTGTGTGVVWWGQGKGGPGGQGGHVGGGWFGEDRVSVVWGGRVVCGGQNVLGRTGTGWSGGDGQKQTETVFYMSKGKFSGWVFLETKDTC